VSIGSIYYIYDEELQKSLTLFLNGVKFFVTLLTTGLGEYPLIKTLVLIDCCKTNRVRLATTHHFSVNFMGVQVAFFKNFIGVRVNNIEEAKKFSLLITKLLTLISEQSAVHESNITNKDQAHIIEISLLQHTKALVSVGIS